MPSGGKREGSGRKKGSKLIKEEVVMIRVPVSLLPLIHTLIAIKKGQGLPWSSHLCFVLLGRLVGFPEDDVFKVERRLTARGRELLKKIKKGYELQFPEKEYPPKIQAQLEKLEQDWLLFLKGKNQGENLSKESAPAPILFLFRKPFQLVE